MPLHASLSDYTRIRNYGILDQKVLPKFGGTVIQTEDEIAACTMAIGANYAGARALTASAGPGLSLMMEAIGLSWYDRNTSRYR